MRVSAVQLPVVKVDLYAAELGELGNFPKNDGGNAPRILTEQALLPWRKITAERVQKNVGVEIEHPRRAPWS